MSQNKSAKMNIIARLAAKSFHITRTPIRETVLERLLRGAGKTQPEGCKEAATPLPEDKGDQEHQAEGARKPRTVLERIILQSKSQGEDSAALTICRSVEPAPQDGKFQPDCYRGTTRKECPEPGSLEAKELQVLRTSLEPRAKLGGSDGDLDKHHSLAQPGRQRQDSALGWSLLQSMFGRSSSPPKKKLRAVWKMFPWTIESIQEKDKRGTNYFGLKVEDPPP